MKLNRFIATALCAMVALTQMTACEEGDSSMDNGGDGNDITLDLSTQRITLDGQDASFSETLSIETDGDWEILFTDETCDWLTLSSSEGSGDAELTIGSADVNPYITARYTEILVSAGDNNEIVYVEQSVGLPRLEIVNNEDLDLTFTNVGTTQIVQFDCNTNWDAVEAYIGESSDWLTLSMSASAGTLSVKANDNIDNVVKLATITITATDVEDPIIINVTQDIDDANATLTVDPASLTFPATGDTKTFEIDSNAQWTIDEISAEDAEWLTISAMSGIGDKKITVEAPDFKGSERSVTLTINYSSTKDPVSFVITQEAYVAAISVEETAKTQEILALGGEKTIDVTSNTTWTAVSSKEWLEVTDGADGENDGSFTIEAGEYTETSADRTATITLTGASVDGDPIVINVTQLKVSLEPVLDLGLEKYNFTTTGGSEEVKEVTITSANTEWSWEKTAESPTDWLTVTGANASGNTASGKLTLSAGENKTSSQQTATITITYDTDKTKTITVTQDALVVETTAVAASYVDGQTIDLVLSSAHTFDSGYTYSSSDFVISYKNDYNGAAEVTGTVTLASAAVSDDGLTLTLTLDPETPIYNSDEITIKTSSVLKSALTGSKNMQIPEQSVKMPKVGVVLSEDFETAGAYDRGWRATKPLADNGNYATLATELENVDYSASLTSYDYANIYFAAFPAYNNTNANVQNKTATGMKIPMASIGNLTEETYNTSLLAKSFLIFSPAIDLSAGEYTWNFRSLCSDETSTTTTKLYSVVVRLCYEGKVYNNDAVGAWTTEQKISLADDFYFKGGVWKYLESRGAGSSYTQSTMTSTEDATVRLVILVNAVSAQAGTFDYIFDEFTLEAKAEERPRN